MATKDFDWESPLVGYERSNTRLFLGLVAMVIILILTVVAMGTALLSMNAQNTKLANNRIMYAFPDEDGVLVSSRRRPPAAVKRYARDFVSNRFNYDADTVEANFKRAANMVVPGKAVGVARQLRDLAERIQNLQLSQKTTILQESGLEESDTGYLYRMRGRVERYVATSYDTTYRVEIAVRLEKVTPTEARPAGLWVTGITETKL